MNNFLFFFILAFTKLFRSVLEEGESILTLRIELVGSGIEHLPGEFGNGEALHDLVGSLVASDGIGKDHALLDPVGAVSGNSPGNELTLEERNHDNYDFF